MEKKTNLIHCALVVVLSLCLVSSPVLAEDNSVSVNELIENSADYNGKSIAITGEAIGECLERGNNAWVNISDGSNAIGIWMTKEEAEGITYYGDYKYTGDTLVITGVFYEACKEHGGEPDIHCSAFKISKAGEMKSEKIPAAKILLAAGFTSLALILYMTYRQLLNKKPERSNAD